MATAVAEARRVLRPGGLLLDIHPADAPMRLEAWFPRELDGRHGQRDEALLVNAGAHDRQVIGDMALEEMAEDFTAASQALLAATDAGFELRKQVMFDYLFCFESLDELTTYLEENEELDLAGDKLLEDALDIMSQATEQPWLVLAQPVTVTLLGKVGD